MSITVDEWQEYQDYLVHLTDEELRIELKWLESVGKAKKRGSVVTSVENNTIQ
jgi:hypothetical protein